MKKIKRTYILGFVLIILIGAGLLITGFVLLNSDGSDDYVETEATVQGVFIRTGDHGTEYNPNLLVFKDEQGNTHSVSCSVWFKRHLSSGDKITIRYKKDDPSVTIVSNVGTDTMTYAFLGFGGFIIVAGIVLTVKYLYDVKRGKTV